MPRIVHVTTVHQPFDTRIFQKEVRSLARSGYDVSLATTLEVAERRDGVQFIPLGARHSRLRRLTRGLRALRAMLRNRDAIVHIHDPELLIVAALPAFAGARLVYDVHEFYIESFRGSSRLPAFLGSVMARIYDIVERLVLPRFAGVVIVSEEMEARYRRFLPRERIALVRNFPNLDVSDLERARAQPHPLGGRPYAIHSGGITKVRAFDDLIAAARNLREAGSDLAIVNLGGSADYSAEELQAVTAQAQDAGVLLRGHVPYHEALIWLAHADIGYLPLKDTGNNRRGLPNKLFEYSLFGLPVVAAEIGRVGDIVTETGSGLLVPPGDGAAHARALMRLMNDPALRSSLAAAALRASRAYSFAGEFEHLRALYAAIGDENET